MREPFTRHDRLLRAALQWKRAQRAYVEAVAQRDSDLVRALDDGCTAKQVIAAFGISRQRLAQLLRARAVRQ